MFPNPGHLVLRQQRTAARKQPSRAIPWFRLLASDVAATRILTPFGRTG